ALTGRPPRSERMAISTASRSSPVSTAGRRPVPPSDAPVTAELSPWPTSSGGVGMGNGGEEGRCDGRAAEEKFSRWFTGQLPHEFPADNHVLTEILPRGVLQIREVFLNGEVVAGADAVEDLAGLVLVNLHLPEARTVGDDIGRQEHA